MCFRADFFDHVVTHHVLTSLAEVAFKWNEMCTLLCAGWWVGAGGLQPGTACGTQPLGVSPFLAGRPEPNPQQREPPHNMAADAMPPKQVGHCSKRDMHKQVPDSENAILLDGRALRRLKRSTAKELHEARCLPNYVHLAMDHEDIVVMQISHTRPMS